MSNATEDLFPAKGKRKLLLSKTKKVNAHHLNDEGCCSNCRKKIIFPAYGDGLEKSEKIQSRCVMYDKDTNEIHALCPSCKAVVKIN